MFCVKFGKSKKAIVYLHGWGSDMNSFLWVKDYFDDFSQVFVDFDGFGKAAEPNKPMTVSDYAKLLKEELDNLNFDELVIVGHSFGGRVAIKFAFLYQNEFNNLKLCLVDSAGIPPRRGLKYYIRIARFKRLKKRTLKNAKLKVKLENYGSSDYKVLSPVMKKTFLSVVNEDLSFNAKSIKCKTLIVWGDKDKETKLFMAKKLLKLIKNSKLVVLKNAGHFSFIDKKREFLIVLDTFVRN